MAFSGEAEPQHLASMQVSPEFFRTLGTRTALGRTFLPSEGPESDARVAGASGPFLRFGAVPLRLVRRGRGGSVEDVRVTNIVMTDVLCPITMNLYYACGAWGDTTVSDRRAQPVTDGTPHFRNIHLSHITARDVKLAAAYLHGLAEMPLEDVSLSDVSITLAVEAEAGYPEMADDIELMQRAGLYVCNTRGLRLHQLEVQGQLGPALRILDSTDVAIPANDDSLKAVEIIMRELADAVTYGKTITRSDSAITPLSGIRGRSRRRALASAIDEEQAADTAEAGDAAPAGPGPTA